MPTVAEHTAKQTVAKQAVAGPKSGQAGNKGSEAGYGWVIVAVLAVTETTSWGVLYYGFSVMLTPMESGLGWSRVALSGAFSVCLATQGLAAVFVGRWLDHHSPRSLMTLGSIAATGLVLAWSTITSLLWFYVLWAVTGVVMATLLYEAAFTVITKWFTVHRRAALTTMTLVAGLASTIFLPLENRLIEAFGWRQALVAMAVILGTITIPLHALFLRPSPQAAVATRSVAEQDPASGANADHSTPAALCAASFWFLAAAYVLHSFAVSALALHQIAILSERGYSAAFAAGATGLLGAMQLPGRLLFAPLQRFLPRRVVTGLVFLLLFAGLVVLASAHSNAGVWTFVVLYGAARGMSTLLRATLVGDLFGAANYGAIAGVLALCTTAALAIGPVAAGLLYRSLGGYDDVLWVLVSVAGVATLCAASVEHWPLRAANC